MGRNPNAANVFNARYGKVGDSKLLFTHRNPITGDLWAEDYKVTRKDGASLVGKWFRSGVVKFDED